MGAFKRWFYDEKTGECQEFYFGGCRGNSNNFMKKIDCEVRCKTDKKSMKNSRIEDIYLNDGFKDALDVLVKKRMNDRSEGMNEGFIEIEEQKEVDDDGKTDDDGQTNDDVQTEADDDGETTSDA